MPNCVCVPRRELATFACHEQMQDRYNKQDAYVAEMKNFACKHHYLVSTQAQPGVFNSPFHVSTNPVSCVSSTRHFSALTLLVGHVRGI